jgi:hypothetical protein
MTPKDHPHRLCFSDNNRKLMERAAALLKEEDWTEAIRVGMRLVMNHSEQYVKGKTEIVYCTPELKDCIENNPAFFEALCQEGVIEWLTPFVLAKGVPLSEQAQ